MHEVTITFNPRLRYKLLTGWDEVRLSETVNEHLKTGWALWGGPIVTRTQSEYGFSTIIGQAVVYNADQFDDERDVPL